MAVTGNFVVAGCFLICEHFLILSLDLWDVRPLRTGALLRLFPRTQKRTQLTLKIRVKVEHLIPALRSQMQVELAEFKAILVYSLSSKQRNPVLKKDNNNK